MIGALMVIISLLFLFYMGSSLVSSTKKYLEQIQGIAVSYTHLTLPTTPYV